MTQESSEIDQLLAQTDALSIAFRALLAVLPQDTARRVRDEISRRVDIYLNLGDAPLSEHDDYARELRAYSTCLQHEGPEVPMPNR